MSVQRHVDRLGTDVVSGCTKCVEGGNADLVLRVDSSRGVHLPYPFSNLHVSMRLCPSPSSLPLPSSHPMSLRISLLLLFRSVWAGRLLVPYLCWASFAGVLNWWIWRENPNNGEGKKDRQVFGQERKGERHGWHTLGPLPVVTV